VPPDPWRQQMSPLWGGSSLSNCQGSRSPYVIYHCQRHMSTPPAKLFSRLLGPASRAPRPRRAMWRVLRAC
jgi:hypothetical protein